jgi:hypothetical protein
LGIQEDYFTDQSPTNIIELGSSIEHRFNRLSTLINESEMIAELSLKSYSFIEHLDELLISNTQKDDAINTLRRVKVGKTRHERDFYSLFAQCTTCNKWYCNEHMSTTNKCHYC